ncbi:MAG: 3-methyl-2-oxobutanoate dehydrogenase subunit VorB [Alphaproteobacteria bacterium]|nr:3-methyl-2-oxobutanoate dehydrogenase subunit VorB [Alphaproteobacteria bacterium]
MSRELMKGNEAVAEAAVRAGVVSYFGYPITPQTELLEYMSRRMPELGRAFVQAESELGAINMVYGAACTGFRSMTSSSSPGTSLMLEGISYIAGTELPMVLVDVMRGGPGLGSIAPAQSDYFQATRGGGNGDYRTVVLAPATVQEMTDLTQEAFDIADLYRIPVLILADGMIGQMMEAVEWKKPKARKLPKKDWATDGTKGKREHNIINSLFIDPKDCTLHNQKLQEKHDRITQNEIRFEEYLTDDAEVLFVAYGTTARICQAAALKLRETGVKAGVFRPISLWPYPEKELYDCANRGSVKTVVCAEMSMGQMIDDVKIALAGTKPVRFSGTGGGTFPTPAELSQAARQALEEV